jgi:uncharacterized Zn-finger protein
VAVAEAVAKEAAYQSEHGRGALFVDPPRHRCDAPGCEYSATTPRNLKRHMLTHSGDHSGERPYPCDAPGCGYRAAQTQHLTTHKRTHSGERPYPCDAPGCEYRSSAASNLKRHMLTHSGDHKRDRPCS